MRCITHGDEDLLDLNRTAKNTLVLINVLRIQPYSLISYRIKFNLQGKRWHWKPWFWVEKRTRYLNINRAADKNWRVKPYSVLFEFKHTIFFYFSPRLFAKNHTISSWNWIFSSRSRPRKSKFRIRLHLDRWWENRLVFRIAKKKIHQNFQASKYDIKQPFEAT